MDHPITITAKGHDYPSGCAVIYCGRGSRLGNPYVMRTKSDSERNRVCDLYERDFPTPEQEAECQRIARLAKVMPVFLECFCAPKRCHVETVKRRVEEILNP
jgi:hypothetical protein